jgi:hypothetical protein
MYGRFGCEIKTIRQGERRKKSHRVARVGIIQENVKSRYFAISGFQGKQNSPIFLT